MCSREFPAAIENVALAIQKLGDMRLRARDADRPRDIAAGTPFILATGTSLPAARPCGDRVRRAASSRWPVYLTIGLAIALRCGAPGSQHGLADDKQRAARRKALEACGHMAWPRSRRSTRSGGTAGGQARYGQRRAQLLDQLSGSTASSTAKATFLAAVRDWLRDDRFDRLEIDGVPRYYAVDARSTTSRSPAARAKSSPARTERRRQVDAAGVISTLIAPNGGEVRYGSHTARSAGARLRHRLGWLGHELQVYPELTARENLQFFARLMGVADGRRGRRRARLIGLETRADEPVSGFSRGMRQRLALERALIHQPRWCCWTNRSPASTGIVGRPPRAAARPRAGRTLVLLATHDVDLAVKCSIARSFCKRPAHRRRVGAGCAGYRAAIGGSTEAMFARTAWLIVRKDLTVEIRSRETIAHDAVLRGVCRARVRVRAGEGGTRREDAAAGILWIAIAFAGTLALGRTFERER